MSIQPDGVFLAQSSLFLRLDLLSVCSEILPQKLGDFPLVSASLRSDLHKTALIMYTSVFYIPRHYTMDTLQIHAEHK